MLQKSDPACTAQLVADLRLSVLIGGRNLGCVAFTSEWTAAGVEVKKIRYRNHQSFLSGAVHENDVLEVNGGYYTLNDVSYKNDVLRLTVHD